MNYQATTTPPQSRVVFRFINTRKTDEIMKVWICLAVVHVCLSSAFADESCGSALDNLETACEYPSKLTLISYPNKRQVDTENCNAEYVKSEWQQEPKVMFPEADINKSYTLLNVDPDPPGYEKGQYYLHWLVSNIKGEDFAKGDLSKANHLQAYYGPAPPAGSGVHRYMFLAFEEDNTRSNREVENPGRRSKFQLVPWLRRQEKLCGPFAGTQFRTQF